MSNVTATAYLEQRLGVKQRQDEDEDKDQVIRGILHTDNYESFILRSDVGDELIPFQGAKQANRCLPGDHVRWNEEKGRCELELQDQHPLLAGTLHLTQPARYGFTRRKVPLYLFTPYDERYPQMVVGSSERDKTRNLLCVVQYENWEPPTLFPRATLQQTLGRSGEMEAERRALLHQVCPWKYPKIPFHPIPAPLPFPPSPRRLLTGYTFHVDPSGCRDVDDILTVESVDDRLWRVVITISDVAAYVEEVGAVDIMASLISQSVYDQEGRVLHAMLPSEYAEGVCSLLPGAPKWGISLEVLWNGTSLSGPVWYESEFRVDRSYTYDQFQEESSAHQAVVREVASHLAGESLTDAHAWIEQVMIYYNKEAGKKLRQAGQGILRRHAAGEKERVEAYRAHLPEWSFLAMSSAEYVMADEPDTYHSGLQTDAYAHVTSPIRRYADLVNQRILKAIIAYPENPPRLIVPVAICDLNYRERVIRQFERDMTFLESIEAGHTRVTARILDREEVEGPQGPAYRVSFYVPAWKKRISALYRKVAEDVIATKDETETRIIRLYDIVEVQCAIQWSLRNWKERLMVQWL